MGIWKGLESDRNIYLLIAEEITRPAAVLHVRTKHSGLIGGVVHGTRGIARSQRRESGVKGSLSGRGSGKRKYQIWRNFRTEETMPKFFDQTKDHLLLIYAFVCITLDSICCSFSTSFRLQFRPRMGVREVQLSSPLVAVEFEVFGHFEGAYFKRYCKEECNKLGIGGWVKTTSRGTIIGKLEGPKAKVDQMIAWMSYNGSPGSQVEQCRLYNFEHLRRPEFRGFSLRF